MTGKAIWPRSCIFIEKFTSRSRWARKSKFQSGHWPGPLPQARKTQSKVKCLPTRPRWGRHPAGERGACLLRGHVIYSSVVEWVTWHDKLKKRTRNFLRMIAHLFVSVGCTRFPQHLWLFFHSCTVPRREISANCPVAPSEEILILKGYSVSNIVVSVQQQQGCLTMGNLPTTCQWTVVLQRRTIFFSVGENEKSFE